MLQITFFLRKCTQRCERRSYFNEVFLGYQPRQTDVSRGISVPIIRMGTEIPLETSVAYTHLTRLMARENFTEFSRREKSRSYTVHSSLQLQFSCCHVHSNVRETVAFDTIPRNFYIDVTFEEHLLTSIYPPQKKIRSNFLRSGERGDHELRSLPI